MKVGIDGDVLRYELGAVALEKTEVFGIEVERPWPSVDVHELVDNRIQSIIEATGCNEYEVFLTGPGNFRFDIATLKPYKGNRSAVEKPYHWQTVSERLLSHWGARIVEGIEADDALAIKGQFAASRGQVYVIASRDKDLRMVPCSHYSWACGESQPEIPVHKVEGIGDLELITREYINIHGKLVKTHKIKGYGLKFFYAQMLTGDSVDNIPGCPNVGSVKAFKLLKNLNTEDELRDTVSNMYFLKCGDTWRENLTENAQLLWLIQDPSWVNIEDVDGVLKFTLNKLWSLPSGYDIAKYESGGEESSSEGSVPEGASDNS